MISKIENEHIEISIESAGAELVSIKSKKEGLEYLWQGNPEFWGRRAPVLFPIVGKLKGNKYLVEGIEYKMSQHGFARDCEFSIVDEQKESIVFRLEDNESTFESYPFRFQLDISYEISNKDLKTKYTIKNMDSKEIYFSVGAHPGFNCPLVEGESFEDYYLEFEADESIDTYILSNGLISKNKKAFLNKANRIQLSKEIFVDDAIILKGLKSEKVSIRSTVSDRAVTVEYPGFPYLGIWSKPEGAPFICIEPWFGIADQEDGNGDLKEKKGIINLAEGCTFEGSYVIFLG